MVVKGWRRSWEMRATILLTAESGSRIGRSNCVLRNDSAGNNRRLHTVRSSIKSPSHPRSAEVQAEGLSCFGTATYPLGYTSRNGIIYTLSADGLCAFNHLTAIS